jgi:hypothetical protein
MKETYICLKNQVKVFIVGIIYNKDKYNIKANSKKIIFKV